MPCSAVSCKFLLVAYATNTGIVVLKLFSCSTELSIKFILHINVKVPKSVGILTFMSRINRTSESCFLPSKPLISRDGLYILSVTVKPVLSSRLIKCKTKVLMEYGSLMQVKSIAKGYPWSNLQYF